MPANIDAGHATSSQRPQRPLTHASHTTAIVERPQRVKGSAEGQAAARRSHLQHAVHIAGVAEVLQADRPAPVLQSKGKPPEPGHGRKAGHRTACQKQNAQHSACTSS